MENKALRRFRVVAVAEGWSYVILLFVAMPLKHFADWPLGVKYVGWAHGLLFVLFAFTLIQAWSERGWTFGKAVLAFICSLIPFGTFWLDRRLKSEKGGW